MNIPLNAGEAFTPQFDNSGQIGWLITNISTGQPVAFADMKYERTEY